MNRSATPTRAIAGALTAGVVLSALAACSDGDGDAAANRTEESPSSASTAQRISPTDLPTAPRLRQRRGAVKDVTVGNCPTDQGRNTVRGSVANPTDQARDYVITISWVTSRSDVVARGIATVRDVAPGSTEDWSATGTIAQSGSYSCTTQVFRGQLARG